MSTLHLVRHGQASFGADDYDRLSELGWRQSRRLGEYWKGKGQQFDQVIMGTLRRHEETWRGIAEGLGLDAQALPVRTTPKLNEYDSAAVIATVHPEPLPKANTELGALTRMGLTTGAEVMAVVESFWEWLEKNARPAASSPTGSRPSPSTPNTAPLPSPSTAGGP